MASATFTLKDEDLWLPDFVLSAPTTLIRVPKKDGTVLVHDVVADGRTLTVTDSRAIRVLKADSRFTLDSETP